MIFRTNISPEVQKTLFKKMKRLSRDSVTSMLEPKDFTDNSSPWGTMLSRACWVRCHTPRVEKDENGKETTELIRLSSAYDGEGEIRNEAISTQNPMASRKGKNIYTTDKGEIYRGAAGITNLSVDTKSFYMKSATVNFKVPNPNEFEKLEKAFLKHGNVVFLEFGWGTPEEDLTNQSKVDFGTFLETQYQLNELNEKSNGNYYGLLGIVSDFSFNIGTDGIYDCNFTLISMGRNILGQSIQRGGIDRLVGEIKAKVDDPKEQLSQEDKELVNDLKRSFVKFESTIENLGKVVRAYTEGKKEQTKNVPNKITKLQYKYRNGAFHITDWPGTDSWHLGLFDDANDGERGYVSWGWFEDQVLNRFFSFLSTKTETIADGVIPTEQVDGHFKSSFRSTSFEQDENKVYKEVENECKSHLHLKSMGLASVILPGFKTLPEYDPTKGDKENLTLIRALNSTFPNFETEKNKYGSIRRMVFPVHMIQKHFKGITSVEQGLTSFWNAVASMYGGFWNFQVVADDYDTGRIGIVEMYGSNSTINVDKDYYDDFKDEVSNSTKNIDNYLTYESPNSTNPNKMFMLPLYSKDSFVKDFSLDVKMSAQMATQAIYGNQSSFKTSGGNMGQGMTDLGVRAMSMLFNDQQINQGEQEVSEDKVMSNIAFPEQIYGVKIGSTFVKDPKSKEIDKLSVSSEHYIDFTQVPEIDKDTNEIINRSKKKQRELKELTTEESIEEYSKQLQRDGSVLFWPFDSSRSDTTGTAIYGEKHGEMIQYFRQVHTHMIMNYPGALDDNNNMSNPPAFYGHIPMTPIKLSVTIDGIGGIKIGNLFVVDYLPQQYRECTHFMVTKVGHDLSTSGWTTKIEAVMQISMTQLTKKRLISVDDERKVVFAVMADSVDKTYENYVKELKKKELGESSEVTIKVEDSTASVGSTETINQDIEIDGEIETFKIPLNTTSIESTSVPLDFVFTDKLSEYDKYKDLRKSDSQNQEGKNEDGGDVQEETESSWWKFWE
tara:strand:- start:7060 stop:10068 length:3009 start_codon:yes stop_codon:yes gene_type:complete